MIDFHTHILPSLDDGCKDVKESLSTLESLVSQGVDTVVLTPHYYGVKNSVDKFLKNRQEAYNTLLEAVENSNLKGKIKFLLGAECKFNTDIIKDFSILNKLAIEGTNYILIELSFKSKWDNNYFKMIDQMIYETGLIPIVAHVEKYYEAQQNVKNISNLLELGCHLQLNADSLFDKRLKNLSKALFKNNLISVIGSDTHNMDVRPPHYGNAIERLKKLNEQKANNIISNMEDIINNKKVKTKSGKINKIFKFYF